MILLFAGLAALGVLLWPLVPLHRILGVLVLVRALGDWGLADGRSPLPGGLVGAAVSLGFCVCLIAPWHRPTPRPAMLALLLSAMWCGAFAVLSVGSTSLGVAALGEALRLFAVVAAGAAAARVRFEDRTRLRRWLLVAVLLPALFMIASLALQLPGTVQSESGRVIGSFSHPNPAGAFFAIGVLFAGTELMRRRTILAGLTGLSALVAIVVTQNLGALAALLAGAVALRLSSAGVSVGRRAAELLGLLVAAALSLLIPQIGGRMGEFQDLDLAARGVSADSGNSLEWRFINWRLLLEEWQQRPWLGSGLSSTDGPIQPLQAPPHSAPVQLLVETGVLGWAAATAGLIALLIIAWRRRTPADHGPSLVVALLVTVIVVGSVDNMLNHAAALCLAAVITGSMLAAPRADPGPRASIGSQGEPQRALPARAPSAPAPWAVS